MQGDGEINGIKPQRRNKKLTKNKTHMHQGQKSHNSAGIPVRVMVFRAWKNTVLLTYRAWILYTKPEDLWEEVAKTGTLRVCGGGQVRESGALPSFLVTSAALTGENFEVSPVQQRICSSQRVSKTSKESFTSRMIIRVNICLVLTTHQNLC